jgi:hypothetical protein
VKDFSTHDGLLADQHESPFEHPAQAMRGQYFKLNGFMSYRYEIEKGLV